MTDDVGGKEAEPSREELIADLQAVTDEIGRIPKLTEMRDLGEYTDRQYFAEFGGWDAAVATANLDIRSQLVETIREIAEEVDGAVTKSDVIEYGPYPPNWYRERFESWDEALAEANIEPATRDEILTEVKRIADATEEVPSEDTFRRCSSLANRDYRAHFESWEDVLDAADLLPSKAEIIAEVHQVADELDTVPSATDFTDVSRYRQKDYTTYFESWEDVLDAADLLPSRSDITAEVRRVAEEFDGVPTATDFTEHSRYRQQDYLREFGSWEQVLEAADVLPSEAEVREEIQRVAEELGRVPTATEFLEHSGLRQKDYRRHFGSWDEALEAAGKLPRRGAIIREIKRLNEELGSIPTASEFRKQSQFRQADYLRFFDSWSDAIENAGLLPTQDEIVEEIRQLRSELGRIPSKDDVVNHGEYRREDYEHQFETWSGALEAANVLPTEIEVVDTIRRLKRDNDRIPTPADFESQTPFRKTDYRRHFASWEKALKRANLLPDRSTVLGAIRSLVSEYDATPTSDAFEDRTGLRKKDYRRYFDNWEKTLETAIATAEDPGELLESIVDGDRLDELRRIARGLGHPPTETYIRESTAFDIETVTNRYREWGTILQAAGLDPDETDRATELALEIEELAEQLDHRPNRQEVIEYLFDDDDWEKRRRVGRALDEANMPAERDLTPNRSLTRQRNSQFEDTIPTHTDLLAELNVVRARSHDDSLAEEYQQRGIIDERHFDVQFGSLSKAIEHLESLDTRAYREPRDRARTMPGPVLTESVEELAEILERRPLLEEVILLSDASVTDFVDAFESWSAVSDVTTPIESWSNETLLTDIERVGRELGKPPSLSEIAEFGTYPAPCYLRRFGNWPRALSLVGVDVSNVPDAYLEFDRTAEVWEITGQLLRTAFAQQDALLDELHRLALEFGEQPSEATIRGFSPYAPEQYRTAFGSVTAGLAAAQFDIPVDASGDSPTSRALGSELKTIAHSATQWILPQDICLESEYQPGTYIGAFGSLEGALAAADLSTAHLAGPTDTYSDIWHSDHQVKTGLLRTIYQITQDRGEPPTMARIESIDGISQKLIYRFFDSWDDALEAAGVVASSEEPSIVHVDHEDVENPDFVDDLLTEMSGMMEDEEP
jgi:hypothetical protein